MLVCPTGVDVHRDLAAHSAAEIAAEVEVNLVGPVLATRALVHLVGDGVTIAILGGFADGRLALPYHSVDVASHTGVAAFCESMTRELPLKDATSACATCVPLPPTRKASGPTASCGAAWARRRCRPSASPTSSLRRSCGASESA